MKKILLVSILIIPLMLITAAIGYAAEPPPPGYTIGGPSVVGTLTLQNLRDDAGNETGLITVTFRGFCKVEYVKMKLCYFYLPVDSFASITKDMLLNYVLQGEGPPDCYSGCGGEDIIITKVLLFRKKGDTITADVIFRFLIPSM